MATPHSQSDELIESGNLDEIRGDLESAQRKYENAVQLAPGYARAWLNLGIALNANAESLKAIDAYRRAIALEPGSAAAHYNLGLTLARSGNTGQAEEALNSAIKHRPVFPDAFAALADLFETMGLLDRASEALTTASEQAPMHPGYLVNLGLIKKKARQLDAAEALFRAALDRDATYAPATFALSGVLREKGHHVDACAVLDRLLALDPGATEAISSKLFTLLFRDDMKPEDVAEEHRRQGAEIQAKLPVRFNSYAHGGAGGRCLKVGYVSGDFNRHSVAFFALPVIEKHDRSAFTVFCYSNSEGADDVTSKFRGSADFWRDIRALDDRDAASLVYEDEIDILIDLSGHTAGNRLAVFSQRPAPVQVTWLGYLSSTGMASMDYRICDRQTDPIGETERLCTETLAVLPGSQWCYRPYLVIDHVEVPPRVANGFPTFGSFNQFAKITPAIRTLWGRILAAIPEAQLLVVGIPQGQSQNDFAKEFAAMGVAPRRLRLVDRVDLESYYRLFNQVDVALDTTPYSGATTTCDALWMAVPVITLAARQPVARSGVSLLAALELHALIGMTEDQYVSKAVALAENVDRLVALRATLREKMQRSPLMDETRFVRDLETLYQQMWNRRRDRRSSS